MKLNKLYSPILIASLALVCQGAQSHEVKCGNLTIAHPYSTPTVGSATIGAVYVIGIKNNGKEADQLRGARADISADVDIHEMILENDIMKMRAVSEVQLPSKSEVSFKHGQPNGYHLMLNGLKKPLKDGDKFSVTLNFKKVGLCQAVVWVEVPKQVTHQH